MGKLKHSTTSARLSSLGETQKALEKYNEALQIFRAIGNRSGEARTLNSIGMVY